jgi:nucleoside-diphosphate-sugar epimerase
MKKVLIIGCGDIGRRVAKHYSNQQPGSLLAWVSSVESASSHEWIEQCDLDSRYLEVPKDVDQIYWFAPPPASGDDDTRIGNFLKANPNLNISRLVYLSTTAVYGDSKGEWIDENYPLQPSAIRGYRRLSAETQLNQAALKHNFSLLILRVPGIYGPGRWPLARLEKKLPMLSKVDAPYTNRIHQDDLAAAAVAEMSKAKVKPGESRAFNVSDGQPSTMTDYFNQIADAFNFDRPIQLPRADAEKVLSSAMMSFLTESKRISTDRIRAELDWQPSYPNLAAGLAADRQA